VNPRHHEGPQPLLRQPMSFPRLDLDEMSGIIHVECWVSLWLSAGDNDAEPVEARFKVDSGATCSSIRLHDAQRLGIPIDPTGRERTIRLRTSMGPVRARILPGQIRGWWNNSLQGYPIVWPVLFRVDAPEGVSPLLGLGSIVRQCRWRFDGISSSSEPYGFFTLEDVRTFS
jgi:hypothetical protein